MPYDHVKLEDLRWLLSLLKEAKASAEQLVALHMRENPACSEHEAIVAVYMEARVRVAIEKGALRPSAFSEAVAEE
jgi:hypothetical protein